MIKWIHWRCRIQSGFLWQDGEGQVMLGGPSGGERQAKGLTPKNQDGGEGWVKFCTNGPCEGMGSYGFEENQKEMEWILYERWQLSRFERKKRYLKLFKCSKWFKLVLYLNLSICMPHYQEWCNLKQLDVSQCSRVSNLSKSERHKTPTNTENLFSTWVCVESSL